MFQIVLSLVAGIFIGWNFHLFYISLEPKNLIPKTLLLSEKYQAKRLSEESLNQKPLNQEVEVSKNEENISSSTIPKKFLNLKLVEKRIIQKIEPKNPLEKVQLEQTTLKSNYFHILLKQNNFSDAMAFYMEGTPQEIKEYQLILKVYFYDKASTEPKETIEQLLQYIEIEPQNLDIQLYLAKLYTQQNEFEKSIDFLFELENNFQDKKLQRIKTDLNIIIEQYISKLNDSKSISKLITFLENIISRSSTPEKYIVQLAKLYKNLETYEKAEELLDKIESESSYINIANNLNREIQEEQIESEQYQYKIPLKRINSHFIIDVIINDTPLKLLLDTGATYTFLDTDKIPNLEGGREVLLNTAGGEIVGELYSTQSLIVQDIELPNFQITVSPFKHQNADGLLGMNFFKQFKFKIDQENAILYLGNQ